MSGWLALLGGLWVLLALIGLLEWGINRRTRQRLAGVGEQGWSPPPAEAEPTPGLGGLAAVILHLGRLVRQAIPPRWASFVRRRLLAAGLRSTLEQFLGIWALALLTWYLLLTALALQVELPGWVALAAVLLSLALPFLHLRHQEAERTRRIRREFPFLIDFITMAVEAGVSLESALVRASQRLKGPIGDELQRFVAGVNRGMTRKEALTALGDGLALPEIRDFIAALIQSSGFGLPLAEVLRRQAEQFRELRRIQAEEAAQKVPVKLLFPLVFFIFPTIFIFVLGPAIIWLLENGF